MHYTVYRKKLWTPIQLRKMKKIAAIILFFSSFFSCFAQEKITNVKKPKQDVSIKNQVEHARFEIIVATIEFLSLDKKIYADVKDKHFYEKKDQTLEEKYQDLRNFSKNMVNVDKLLITPYKDIPLNYSDPKNSLNKFITDITTEITTDKSTDNDATKPKKANRKIDLSKEYDIYIRKLESIVAKVSFSKELNTDSSLVAMPVVGKPQTTTISSTTISSNVDDNKPDSNSNKSDPDDNDSKLPSKGNKMPFILNIIFFIFSFVFLGLYVKVNRNKKDLESSSKKASEIKNVEIQRRNQQASELRAELEETRKKLDDANITIDRLNAELDKSKITQKPHQSFHTSYQTEPLVNNQNAYKPSPQQSTTIIKYAIYADQGDGFSSGELHDNESNDTVFEIKIKSPNSAEFKISSNVQAQKSALIDPSSFLNKTCEYDGSPSRNTIIKTNTPGELKLQGNKWLIITPAKISFT